MYARWAGGTNNKWKWSIKQQASKNQNSSFGTENAMGERGGRSPLAIASRRAKGGNAGVEGERFKDNFSDGRDGTLKIGLIADLGALKPGLGECADRCPPYGNSFDGDGIVRCEGLGCCTLSSALPPPCSVRHDPAGDKLKVCIGGGEPRSESEVESIDACGK